MRVIRPIWVALGEGQRESPSMSGLAAGASLFIVRRSSRRSNPVTASPGSVNAPGPIQASVGEAFHELLLANLEQELSGKWICQDLVADHGFAAKHHRV